MFDPIWFQEGPSEEISDTEINHFYEQLTKVEQQAQRIVDAASEIIKPLENRFRCINATFAKIKKTKEEILVLQKNTTSNMSLLTRLLASQAQPHSKLEETLGKVKKWLDIYDATVKVNENVETMRSMLGYPISERPLERNIRWDIQLVEEEEDIDPTSMVNFTLIIKNGYRTALFAKNGQFFVNQEGIIACAVELSELECTWLNQLSGPDNHEKRFHRFKIATGIIAKCGFTKKYSIGLQLAHSTFSLWRIVGSAPKWMESMARSAITPIITTFGGKATGEYASYLVTIITALGYPYHVAFSFVCQLTLPQIQAIATYMLDKAKMTVCQWKILDEIIENDFFEELYPILHSELTYYFTPAAAEYLQSWSHCVPYVSRVEDALKNVNSGMIGVYEKMRGSVQSYAPRLASNIESTCSGLHSTVIKVNKTVMDAMTGLLQLVGQTFSSSLQVATKLVFDSSNRKRIHSEMSTEDNFCFAIQEPDGSDNQGNCKKSRADIAMEEDKAILSQIQNASHSPQADSGDATPKKCVVAFEEYKLQQLEQEYERLQQKNIQNAQSFIDYHTLYDMAQNASKGKLNYKKSIASYLSNYINRLSLLPDQDLNRSVGNMDTAIGDRDIHIIRAIGRDRDVVFAENALFLQAKAAELSKQKAIVETHRSALEQARTQTGFTEEMECEISPTTTFSPMPMDLPQRQPLQSPLALSDEIYQRAHAKAIEFVSQINLNPDKEIGIMRDKISAYCTMEICQLAGGCTPEVNKEIFDQINASMDPGTRRWANDAKGEIYKILTGETTAAFTYERTGSMKRWDSSTKWAKDLLGKATEANGGNPVGVGVNINTNGRISAGTSLTNYQDFIIRGEVNPVSTGDSISFTIPKQGNNVEDIFQNNETNGGHAKGGPLTMVQPNTEASSTETTSQSIPSQATNNTGRQPRVSVLPPPLKFPDRTNMSSNPASTQFQPTSSSNSIPLTNIKVGLTMAGVLEKAKIGYSNFGLIATTINGMQQIDQNGFFNGLVNTGAVFAIDSVTHRNPYGAVIIEGSILYHTNVQPGRACQMSQQTLDQARNNASTSISNSSTRFDRLMVKIAIASLEEELKNCQNGDAFLRLPAVLDEKVKGWVLEKINQIGNRNKGETQ